MSWERTAPQEARRAEGWIVGNAGREAVEYVDGARRALIAIDRGRRSSRLRPSSAFPVEKL